MVPTCRFARFCPGLPVSGVLIAPVVATGTGSTAVAGGGDASTVALITRNTVSMDCVVKLEETTMFAALTPAAAAAPKCERARPHNACRRASVMEPQLPLGGLASAAA